MIQVSKDILEKWCFSGFQDRQTYLFQYKRKKRNFYSISVCTE